MKFQSEAQKAKLAQLVQQGKLSQTTFDRMAQNTGATPLPERAKPQIPKVTFVKKAPVIK